MGGAVLQHPIRLAAIGIPIGILVTIAVARTGASLLFGLAPEDPVTLGLGALFVLAVAVAAGALPASRATRVDPIVALRYE